MLIQNPPISLASIVQMQRNIAQPGIVEYPTGGMWPSLVVAHKIYADGQRYQDIESYNPRMLPFWIGRSVIAPAR